MALTLSKTWSSGDTLTHTDLNNNFTDVANKFSAGITTADLSASAGITNAQLANSVEETLLTMELDGTRAAAATAGEYVALVPLPYDSASTTGYTVEAVEWVVYDPDAGISSTKTFKLWFGDPTLGPGVDSAAIGDAAGFTSTASATSAGAFSTGMGSTTVTPGATPQDNMFMLELDAETGDTGWDADVHVAITIRLSRALRT